MPAQTATAAPKPDTSAPPAGGLGLGLDAGGTQTRWAVADAAGQIHAEGLAAPLAGLQLDSEAGRAVLRATLRAIAQAIAQVPSSVSGASAAGDVSGVSGVIASRAVSSARAVKAVVAGVTGLAAAQAPALRELLAASFNVAPADVQALSDIEALCLGAFAPGAGIVIYAGTGAIAACIDAAGTLQRAGGRGPVIDDAGGGHWIAREALRHIWRAEDEAPGAWPASALARRVFAHIGGSDWADSRAWVYGATRGELGTLALAVAAAADEDPAALAILQAAGTELARLGAALVRRHGLQPLALAGRVFDLHPAVENALTAALPSSCTSHRLTTPAHHAAARRAAQAHTRNRP